MKQTRKTSQIRLFERNETNPFMETTIKTVKDHTRIKTEKGKTDDEARHELRDNNGEVRAYSVFETTKVIENDKFTKIYEQGFSKFYDLNKNGMKVLGYILKTLTPSKDEIYLHIEDCMKYTEYKGKASVLIGISSLLEAGLIAKGRAEHLYFINPNCFFQW